MLDVGCGTGKVARALLQRGLSVLGVEFDERMAAIARGHGVEVELGAFEDWDARGRTFDLIVASDSWHWIDPVRGWRKVGAGARAGRDHGRGSWNQLTGSSRRCVPCFDEIYARVAPGIAPVAPGDLDGDDPRAENRTYRWPATYGADDYVALARHLQHLRCRSIRTNVAELPRELHAAIMAARRRPSAARPDARQSFACSAALSPAQLPERGSASTVPVRRVAAEQQAVRAAQLAPLDDLAVRQRDQRARR